MNDDDFMVESEEDYDFQYSEAEEEEENQELDRENEYYNAKSLKSSNARLAIQRFQEVIATCPVPSEWTFRCLKQLIKLEYALGQCDEVIEHFLQFLAYSKSVISVAYFERSLSNLLEHVSSLQDGQYGSCIEKLYEETLALLIETKNERLWVRTQIKLANLWLSRREFGKLGKCISQLNGGFFTSAGDSIKSNFLLEIISIEMQMYTELGMTKRLKNLYNQASTIRTAVPHPKTLGIIRECGGKMHLVEGNWKAALADFFESFRSYDEAGSPNRLRVLKYVAISSILAESKVDPFESQETKPYRNDPSIVGFVGLVAAFQHKDICKFKSFTSEEKAKLTSDPSMISYINEINRILSDEIIGSSVDAYITADLQNLSERHAMDYPEVQNSLSFLVTEGKQNGKISQLHRNCKNQSSAPSRSRQMNSLVFAVKKLCRLKDDLSGILEDDSYLTSAFGLPI